jgi:hypothetical protein
MAVVAAVCAAWPTIRPEIRTWRFFGGETVETHFIWRNGTILTITRDSDRWLPKVEVANGKNVDIFFRRARR